MAFFRFSMITLAYMMKSLRASEGYLESDFTISRHDRLGNMMKICHVGTV